MIKTFTLKYSSLKESYRRTTDHMESSKHDLNNLLLNGTRPHGINEDNAADDSE